MASAAGEALEQLTILNTEELVKSFKLEKPRWIRPLWSWVLRFPSAALSRRVLDYDRSIAALGLAAASASFTRSFVRDLVVEGSERIPRAGPVLLTSNHPGQTDTLSVFSAIPRADLKIIAGERALLRALPNLRRRLIEVAEAPERRGRATREAVRQLEGGGALLTFPAGQIEPDPAIHADAEESVAGWSESVALFARLVPGTAVVPAIVSGVMSPAALANPVARSYRGRKQQEWVAAALQIMLRRYQDVTVRVSFGTALRFRKGAERSEIMHAVRTETLDLIRRARAVGPGGNGNGKRE